MTETKYIPISKKKMTREELEKEAEGWLNKWKLCNKCENKVNCISNFSYCKKVVLQSYLASAEPREKRIAELEEKNRQLKNEVEDLTAYCDQIGKIKTGILKLFEHVVAR